MTNNDKFIKSICLKNTINVQEKTHTKQTYKMSINHRI